MTLASEYWHTQYDLLEHRCHSLEAENKQLREIIGYLRHELDLIRGGAEQALGLSREDGKA